MKILRQLVMTMVLDIKNTSHYHQLSASEAAMVFGVYLFVQVVFRLDSDTSGQFAPECVFQR